MSGTRAGGAPLDVLVLGSGVAGLSAAVRLAANSSLRVGVLTKSELAQSATKWAQGGVAAVLGGDEDSTDLHLADTLAAGAGLCDVEAVRVLVDEGPNRVRELIGLGAVFDRDARGALSLAREGGHSTARVLHAGGAATGAEVERALVSAVTSTAAALLEQWFATDLIVSDGRCVGVYAVDPTGATVEVRAGRVVLATGGAGQLFAVNTNPPEATGDGISMALRAGAPVADLEFFQFHPTALHHLGTPRPLLSEALRGHGALLRNAGGERFVDELLPRDVVSRAMAASMRQSGVEHLWLDATGLEMFDTRFPNLSASLSAAGLDPAEDWIPIAPAAHHLSGGVVTDLDGASAMPGLWAVGEAACTGVHGANRLASNSLLEGMVFGARLSEAILAGKDLAEPTGAMAGLIGRRIDGGADPGTSGSSDVAPIACELIDTSAAGVKSERHGEANGDSANGDSAKLLEGLQRAMTEGAGILRSEESLALASTEVERIAASLSPRPGGRHAGELYNLVELARALLTVATYREESRGAHARIDFPGEREHWRRRIVIGDAAYVDAE